MGKHRRFKGNGRNGGGRSVYACRRMKKKESAGGNARAEQVDEENEWPVCLGSDWCTGQSAWRLLFDAEGQI